MVATKQPHFGGIFEILGAAVTEPFIFADELARLNTQQCIMGFDIGTGNKVGIIRQNQLNIEQVCKTYNVRIDNTIFF